MSSIAKGDAFEDRVYEAIKEELDSGRLGFTSQTCKVFQKKGYYSRDRDAEIIVDISVEVWLPNASSWSILWVCECKDYSRSLPVDDVEEFKSKLEQIAGKNVKGVMALTGSMQRSALNFARSNGIGIIRIMPDDQVEWVMYHMTLEMMNARLDSREFLKAFTSPQYVSTNRSFFGSTDGYIFDSWSGFLRRALRSVKREEC